jgi:hypothetical protein
MNKFYAAARAIGGRVHWPQIETERMQKFLKTLEGKPILVTISPLSSRRSDEMHRLYRKRNDEIAAYTGESPERLHEYFFRKLHLGVYADEPEAKDEQTRRRQVVRRFFRESANDVTTEDMKALLREQSLLVAELNEGLDPAHWLRLSGDEIK